MKKAIKLIKKFNPDILVLTEAYFWPFAKKSNLINLNKIFKNLYNENTSLAYTYFRWAPIVLSKFKIENFDTSLSQYQLNFLRTEIKIKGKPVTLDVFHPHPDTTEEQKLEFLKKVLKNKRKNRILTGDFNALSIEDKYEKPRLIKGYESFMGNKGKDKVNDMLKGFSTKLILENGFIDTYKLKNKKTDFTMPTDLRSKNKGSSVRIDYIFCSKNFKALDSGIIKNNLAEEASDHYPVYAILEI